MTYVTIRVKWHSNKPCSKDYLEPLSLKISEVADDLGVSRKTISKIVNEKGSITAQKSKEWEDIKTLIPA